MSIKNGKEELFVGEKLEIPITLQHCGKIDKYNYKAMVEGFDKGDKKIKTSIYCQTRNLPFREWFLLTPAVTNNDKERPPSELGKKLFNGDKGEYPKEIKYVGAVDTIYYLKENKIEIWKEICTNSLWDIWEPEAPSNTLGNKCDPKLYLLRICEINKSCKEGEDYKRHRKDKLSKPPISANIVERMIYNKEFSELKKKLTETLNKHMAIKGEPEPVFDTIYYFNNYEKDVGDRQNRQSDIAKRKEIEKLAMSVTEEHYKKDGYEIKYVQKDNKGWDIEASKGNEHLLLEVKGLSGDEVSTELTPNEYDKMKEYCDKYRICVVTNALSDKPQLSIFKYFSESKKWLDEKCNQLQVDPRTGAKIFI